jgi:hypothetical protein
VVGIPLALIGAMIGYEMTALPFKPRSKTSSWSPGFRVAPAVIPIRGGTLFSLAGTF